MLISAGGSRGSEYEYAQREGWAPLSGARWPSTNSHAKAGTETQPRPQQHPTTTPALIVRSFPHTTTKVAPHWASNSALSCFTFFEAGQVPLCESVRMNASRHGVLFRYPQTGGFIYLKGGIRIVECTNPMRDRTTPRLDYSGRPIFIGYLWRARRDLNSRPSGSKRAIQGSTSPRITTANCVSISRLSPKA